MTSHPPQSPLTKGNDLSKTEETRRVVAGMVGGLNDHAVDKTDSFFAPDFRWMGNAGCGVKLGLADYVAGWQQPFIDAFSERVFIDEARVTEGEWMSAFGHCKAVHSGTFMGIPATGKTVEIRYMDFWHVKDGKILDNWVSVDFPHVMRQLGVDPFDGRGWEKTSDERVPAFDAPRNVPATADTAS